MNKTDEELNLAEAMAKRYGVRMCDENGDAHGEELYCVGIDGIADIIREALAETVKQKPIELQEVKRVVEEGSGFWRECSGCYESNEGAPPNGAVFSKAFDCYLGNGCSECGGLGAIWDNTDYEEMARFMAAQDAAPVQTVKQEPVMGNERIFALREAERNGSEHNYFNARPHNDTPTLRGVFCQGFDRGFNKGLKYAAPVERQWVDLTDDELKAALEVHQVGLSVRIGRIVIAAFKEKNK